VSLTSLEQIRNFYVLGDDIATGGQPLADQFAALKDAGFDVVINLALADSPGAVKNEDEIIHNLGMVYKHIPVNFYSPMPDDLDLFFHNMELHRGKRIFVHCALNWRVSCFMFLYRTVKCDCPVERAMHDLHAIWQPDDTWRNFIDTALDSYNHKL
jgi:protein tyrosine phosphatase (PTP) superfamily phosphohydrolase (DUF442 family)